MGLFDGVENSVNPVAAVAANPMMAGQAIAAKAPGGTLGNVGHTVNTLAGGGPNNAGFVAGAPQLQMPTTVDQANRMYDQSQGAIGMQGDFAKALMANNAAGNANQSFMDQRQLSQALGAQGGINNQSNVFNQMQNQANALQSQANGTGPNPAQAQFMNNLNANTAAAAGTIASQKGINPALAARMIAQQQGAAGQNAAGQAAVQQAQQQLAANQQLGQQQGMMAGLAGQQVGQQIGQGENVANLANNQIGQTQGALSNFNQANQGEQGMIMSGINAQNNVMASTTGNQNAANAAMSQTNANNSAGAVGGLINSLGGAGMSAAMPAAAPLAAAAAHGGMAAPGGKFYGGESENKKVAKVDPKKRFPVPEHLHGLAEAYHGYSFGGMVENVGSPDAGYQSMFQGNQSQLKGQGPKIKPVAAVPGQMPDQGPVSDTSNGFAQIPNEGPVMPGQTNQTPMGYGLDQPMGPQMPGAAGGAIVKGPEKVAGDSKRNDVVPAMLSAGEIILPKSITESDDAPAKAAKFVAELLKKHGKSLDKETTDFKSALASAISSRKKGKAS